MSFSFPASLTIAAAHEAPPFWTVIPFALYLLAIAVAPLLAGHFWEHNRNKLLLAIGASVPVAVYLLIGPDHGAEWLFDSLKEYAVFIVLLGALYVISGGIHVGGSIAGTPLSNTLVLAAGSLLASMIGTTGASMLLIRPLLKANASRENKAHIVVFFIFVVSNAGGLLTPLGDPPLFLGFLRGVPFLWTLRLLGPWALVNTALLTVFNVVDQVVLNREERKRPGAQLEQAQTVKEPLRIEGGVNLLWLLGVLGTNLGVGYFASRAGLSGGAQQILLVAGMLAMMLLSLLTTRREVRAANAFQWGPIIEVACIFLGVFVTMVPALHTLELRGAELGLTKPWQFFWATGLLSGFLDNAPTYLTFASLGTGVVNRAHPGALLSADDLGGLLAFPDGQMILVAVSCGAVFMGANTYIGNGPNFMVKAIAEASRVRMPGFFAYMLWSVAVLIPLFLLATLVFFRD